MNAAKTHAYRFGFLKSEAWRTVRVAALAKAKGRCNLCLYRNLANDAHHLWYPPNVYETREEDLVILCRPCHEFIHNVLPKPTSKEPREEAMERYYLFKSHLVAWLEIMRHEVRPRMVEHSNFLNVCKGHTDHSKICWCCNWERPTQWRNILIQYAPKWRELRICDECWSELLPQLTAPAPYGEPAATVSRIRRLIRAHGKTKRLKRIAEKALTESYAT